jgi:hypothetical protein
MSVELPSNEEDIDLFLTAFENGTLPKERWTHAAHIFGGACYVHRLGEAVALDHMRLSVKRYNIAVGGQNTPTSGYHETITVFWIKLLAAFLATHQPVARTDFAALAVSHLAPQRNIYARYYSYHLVDSSEARAHWQPPDLQPLP